jgi:hypothetical protein
MQFTKYISLFALIVALTSIEFVHAGNPKSANGAAGGSCEGDGK